MMFNFSVELCIANQGGPPLLAFLAASLALPKRISWLSWKANIRKSLAHAEEKLAAGAYKCLLLLYFGSRHRRSHVLGPT